MVKGPKDMKRYNKILSILLILSILITPVLGLLNSSVNAEEGYSTEETSDILMEGSRESLEDDDLEKSKDIKDDLEPIQEENPDIDSEIQEETQTSVEELEILEEEPETLISEEEKIKSVLTKLYNEFSVHGFANPIPFPYGEGEGQYTNAIVYMEDRLKELAPEYDVKFKYSSMLPGTVGSTDVLKQTTMDSLGNITPVYNESPSKPVFMGVQFEIQGIETEKKILLYFAVDPIPVSDQEMVDKEASAIIFDLIKGRNASQEYITGSIGKASGSTIGALNTTPELYKTDIKIEWSLKHIEGNSNALSLDSNNKTAVIRPNVDEGDAKFKLAAMVSHRSNDLAKKEVEFDLTVPAFVGYKAPIRITPADAKLEITDSYYKTLVDDKYISIKEDGSLREFILHGNVTDGSQNFSYVASKEGYITKKGTISVNGKDLDEVEISLEPSSSNDSKLQSLEITSPSPNAPSIIEPMEDFKPENLNYTMKVGNIPSITIRPTVMAEGATIVVNAATSSSNSTLRDYSVSSGRTRVCYLFEGENTIKITVKVPDSSTQEIREECYVLKVTKDSSKSYPLKGITIKPYDSYDMGKNNLGTPQEEIISPAIETGGIAKEYIYYVNSYRDSVDITPVAADISKIEYIKVNGAEIAKTSEKIALEYGNNKIKVEVKEKDVDNSHIYNINVRRKHPVTINSYSADGYTGKLTNWTGQVNFAHNSTEVDIVFDIPEDSYITIDGIEGQYYRNQIVKVPIADLATKMFTIRVNKETIEDGISYIDSHAYVIGFYRMASSAPDAVENYIPAPGQFVNQSSYQDPSVTLRPNPSMVTLGAFGGNIVYRFDEPIKNDPNNPYGIDFIVYGNVFRNTDGSSAQGASEPAAVMVSKDGDNWYELAGSLYYDATTRHNIEVTYTNPDNKFIESKDVPWKDNEGNSGVIRKNSSHNQPYYPNPEYYDKYNKESNIGYNSSYSASTIKFSGSMLQGRKSPAFGYADTHAHSDDYSQKAVNPYVQNHYAETNGDGMDISWAVDREGNPVDLEEIKYVKIYNPNLHIDGGTGEISPEIAFIQKTEGTDQPVGITEDLKSLSINGKDIDLIPGKYDYNIDIEGASSFIVNASLSPDANIWVNDNWVKSGTDSPYMLAGRTFRIVAQEGIKEPVIYIIHLENVTEEDDNADIKNITILPGDINAVRDGNTFSAVVDNSISDVIVKASPLSKESKVYIDSEQVYENNNWQSNKYIKINAGETKSISIEVVSKSGIKEIYTLNITRKEVQEEGPKNTIQVYFRLIGDTKHGEGGHTGNITWISTEKHSVPVGSTVKYLTDMVLAKHGIPFRTNPSGTYIESINGLSEFDNGPNSGWMYKINGTHRNVDGYATQVLNQGDTIEWHYTDDYTKEEGAEDFGHNTGSENSSENKVEKQNTITSNITGISDKNGVSVATLRGDDLKKLIEGIEQIKNEKGTKSEIHITAAKESLGFALSLPSTIFETLKNKNKIDLIIKSDIGGIKLDPNTIKEINNNITNLPKNIAGNENVNIDIIFKRAKDSVALKEKNIQIYEDHLYDLKILINGSEFSDFKDGMVELFFPIKLSKDMKAENLSVYHINSAGEIEKLKGIIYDTGKLYGEPGVIATTNSFSLFAIAYTSRQLFDDLPLTHWAYDDISFMVNRKLIKGVGNNKFEPNREMTRAEFTQILLNISEDNVIDEKDLFSDINLNDWYFKAVNWAYNNKIIFGKSKDRFMPNTKISRQDAAVMVKRYLDHKGYENVEEIDEIKFKDFDKISSYAKEAVEFLTKAGLINGKGNDIFDPDSFMTRSEAVSIVARILRKLDL